MDSRPRPLAFLLLLVSGWVNRQQQSVIDYLLEENRILRAAHAPRRLRLTDDQGRRLAVKGILLGRRRLAALSGIVTPDTILRWYRRLVSQKYDGSHTRRIRGLEERIGVRLLSRTTAGLHRRMPASSCWAGCVPRSGMSRPVLDHIAERRERLASYRRWRRRWCLRRNSAHLRRKSRVGGQRPPLSSRMRSDGTTSTRRITRPIGMDFARIDFSVGTCLSVRLSELPCHLRGGSCLGRFCVCKKPSTQTQLPVDR